MKLARDNVVDSELTVTATADLKLLRPKTIRDLTLTTNLGWHLRTADLRAKKFLENSFTKLEAPMRDFSARNHATASSATTAKAVQPKTAIDTTFAPLRQIVRFKSLWHAIHQRCAGNGVLISWVHFKHPKALDSPGSPRRAFDRLCLSI